MEDGSEAGRELSEGSKDYGVTIGMDSGKKKKKNGVCFKEIKQTEKD